MSVLIENYIPVIKYQGFNTEKDIVSSGAFTLSGVATLSGAANFSGAVAFTGSTSGVKRSAVVGTSATYALSSALSGTVYVATKTSATQTYNLPAVATSAGSIFTFICGHADGEILVTPKSGEAIVITTFAAVGADADTSIVAPAAGTGIKNTAGSNAVGDNLTLVCDGTKWIGVGITGGIWASQ